MRFKRFTFSLLSPLLGFHYGRNPVSGQRFLHVAPFPFFGIDFEFKPYRNEEMLEGKTAYEGFAEIMSTIDPDTFGRKES